MWHNLQQGAVDEKLGLVHLKCLSKTSCSGISIPVSYASKEEGVLVVNGSRPASLSLLTLRSFQLAEGHVPVSLLAFVRPTARCTTSSSCGLQVTAPLLGW
ncbi:hypothetical protein AOLI_G00169170 [Acnodon oligacanthus]